MSLITFQLLKVLVQVSTTHIHFVPLLVSSLEKRSVFLLANSCMQITTDFFKTFFIIIVFAFELNTWTYTFPYNRKQERKKNSLSLFTLRFLYLLHFFTSSFLCLLLTHFINNFPSLPHFQNVLEKITRNK